MVVWENKIAMAMIIPCKSGPKASCHLTLPLTRFSCQGVLGQPRLRNCAAPRKKGRNVNNRAPSSSSLPFLFYFCRKHYPSLRIPWYVKRIQFFAEFLLQRMVQLLRNRSGGQSNLASLNVFQRTASWLFSGHNGGLGSEGLNVQSSKVFIPDQRSFYVQLANCLQLLQNVPHPLQ